jgi:ATP-dependent helicase/nuclease subunit B
MSISRTFLGWSEPILQAAVKLLVANHREESSLNFSGVTCALPGRRAGRKLLELLANEGERLGVAVIPPRIITAGNLPETLLGITFTQESTLRKQLLWHTVLKEADPECLSSIFPKIQKWGDSLNMTAWELGTYLDSLRKELGGSGKTFKDIPRLVEGFASEERWQALAKLEDSYLELAERTNTVDQLSIRLSALKSPKLITGQLYLIGLTDLNLLTKNAMMGSALQIVALVGAPEDKNLLFDDFGCVKVDSWRSQILPISLNQINRAEKLSDEAGILVKEVSSLAQNGEALSDITIGVIDAADIPVLSEELNRVDITLRPPEGTKYKDVPTIAFLSLLISYIEDSTAENLGSLIRHPLCSALVVGADINQVIKWLDDYQGKHLQNRIEWPMFANSNEGLSQSLEKLFEFIRSIPTIKAPLTAWRREIVRVLQTLHPEPLGVDTVEREAVTALANFFNEADELSDDLIPKMTLTQSLRLAIKSLQNSGASPKEHGDCVEGIGWLELFHDDARNLLITGFHERALPEAINEDPLLPDDLRQRAGLQSNESRYARDAFLVTALMHSRNYVRFSYAAIDDEGVERGPSRLFFACKESELTERVGAILKPASITSPKDSINHSIEWAQSLKPTAPLPENFVLRVTDFKAYMDCPYQYYLSRESGLRGATDNFQELDAANFGNAIHKVLERFAKTVEGGSLDEPDIVALVHKLTDDLWDAEYGANSLPVVFIQKEVVKERLRVWAKHQAELFAEGWRIHAFEEPIRKGAFELDLESGQKVSVVGRIDRIDFNQTTNSYRVIDYKTSESAREAKSTKTKKAWKDLQLPLYYWIAKGLGLGENISVAYMNISGDHAASGITELANADFDQALDQAKAIAELIISRKLWPAIAKTEPFDESIRYITNQLSLFAGEAQ